MAVLVNGDGNKAIWAQQDADLIASLAGNVTGIADVGSKFAATQEDANTIGLADGVIVTKEGRRIQLNAGNTDLFDIPTGTSGVTSYYIIGYHLYTQSDSSQVCETFVQKMNNSSATITEDTFRGGATEVYVSCYRVIQTGLNITAINALLPNIESLSKLKSALANLGNFSTNEVKIGTFNGVDVYKRTFYATSVSITGEQYISSTFTSASVSMLLAKFGNIHTNNGFWFSDRDQYSGSSYEAYFRLGSSGVQICMSNYTCDKYSVTFIYTKT